MASALTARELVVDKFRIVRELGSRAAPTYAATHDLRRGKVELVTLQRVTASAASEQDFAHAIRDTEKSLKLKHLNVVRVREIVNRADETWIQQDFIDGETFASLLESVERDGSELTIELLLRVLVDALSGVGAIHALCDGKKERVIVHRQFHPENILVGLDGVGRVLLQLGAFGSPRGKGFHHTYLAPEVLLNDAIDPRADVFSAGAILWRIVARRPLFLPDISAHAMLTQVLSEKMPAASVDPNDTLRVSLLAIATRALAADPEARFPSASAMALEIRRTLGAKLPSTTAMAAYMKGHFQDRVTERRGILLGQLSSGVAKSVRPPAMSVPAPSNATVTPLSQPPLGSGIQELSPQSPFDPGVDIHVEADEISQPPTPRASRAPKASTSIAPLAPITPISAEQLEDSGSLDDSVFSIAGANPGRARKGIRFGLIGAALVVAIAVFVIAKPKQVASAHASAAPISTYQQAPQALKARATFTDKPSLAGATPAHNRAVNRAERESASSPTPPARQRKTTYEPMGI